LTPEFGILMVSIRLETEMFFYLHT
jgi:hypothetical protein